MAKIKIGKKKLSCGHWAIGIIGNYEGPIFADLDDLVNLDGLMFPDGPCGPENCACCSDVAGPDCYVFPDKAKATEAARRFEVALRERVSEVQDDE